MATIAKMAINLGWNGQQAEEGLDRAKKKTKELGNDTQKASEKAEKSTSIFGNLYKTLKGANDIKSTFEMARGVGQLFIGAPVRAVASMVSLGSELETLQIKTGALVGDFEKGTFYLEQMRQTTRDMGVPLTTLTDAFGQLVGAGIGSGDAEKLLRTFSAIAPLLGQGGIGQLAGSIAAMAKSGIAEQAGLQQLQQSGLPVYEALAEKLTRITGVFHDMKSAQEAVERGAVLASTAIGAMQDAAKSPQAIEAAQRISNSVEGQLSRLKEGFTELLRDIGTGLIKGLDIPAFLASLRGVFEAVQAVVSQILSAFTDIAGPSGRGKSLEESFKNARNFVFDMMEAVVRGIQDAYKYLKSIIDDVKNLDKKAIGFIAEKSNPVGGSVAGSLVANSLAGAIKKSAVPAGKDFGESMLEYISRARAGTVWHDMQRAADMVPGAAGGANIELSQRSAAINDPFQALRDMQMQMRQGGLLAGSKVAEAFGSFIKNGQADPNAWMAGKIEAGTQAAADAILQHQYGQTSVSLQQQIADGIKATEELNKRQVENEQEMIKILKTLRLPTARV